MSTDTNSAGPKLDNAADWVVRMDSSDQAISSIQWTHPLNMPAMLSVTTWMGSISVYSIHKDGNNTITSSPITHMNAPKATTCVARPNVSMQQNFGNFSQNSQEKFIPNSLSLPLLCSSLTENGDLFAAGCSGCVYHYDLKTMGSAPSTEENYRIVARHAQPVKALGMLPDSPLLVTASWDKTVRVWDLRQPLPNAASPLYNGSGNDGSIAKFLCSGPVHDLAFGPPMATNSPVVSTFGTQALASQPNARIGIALSARDATLIDFSKMQIIKTLKPLPTVRNQMTCVSILTNEQNFSYGFAAGCKDGRAMVKLFDDEQLNAFNQPMMQSSSPSKVSKSFSFVGQKIEKPTRIASTEALKPGHYPVNAIQIHPQFPSTILTAGGDGSVRTWDIEKRRSIRMFEYGYQPISAAKFSGSGGDMLAIALGYDWSRGPANFKNNKAGGVIVKTLKLEDVQSK